jgi:hypothetical protein
MDFVLVHKPANGGERLRHRRIVGMWSRLAGLGFQI